jgi:membrane-associated protease RseP (regulator of RpoE activity)
MSENPLPAEVGQESQIRGTPTWLWAVVGAIVLIALAAGGIGGFEYGRQFERTQGCPTCVYPDETFWLLGASLDDQPQGVTFVHVASGGPADAASLHDGDRLITVDDQPVNSAAEGRTIFQGYGAGAQVSLTIERNHQVHQIDLLLGSSVRVYPPPIGVTPIFPPPFIPPQSHTPAPYPPPDGYGEPHLGVTYRMLLPGDPSGLDNGAMLIQVSPHGPAGAAGLTPGDIILSVDNVALSESYTLEDALTRAGPRPFAVLTVHKTNGETVTVRALLIGKPFPYPEPMPIPYNAP